MRGISNDTGWILAAPITPRILDHNSVTPWFRNTVGSHSLRVPVKCDRCSEAVCMPTGHGRVCHLAPDLVVWLLCTHSLAVSPPVALNRSPMPSVDVPHSLATSRNGTTKVSLRSRLLISSRVRFANKAKALCNQGVEHVQGPHLTVDFDTWFASELCQSAADRLSPKVTVLVLPATPYGPAPEHRAYGGFIDLRQTTFEKA